MIWRTMPPSECCTLRDPPSATTTPLAMTAPSTWVVADQPPRPTNSATMIAEPSMACRLRLLTLRSMLLGRTALRPLRFTALCTLCPDDALRDGNLVQHAIL